MAQLLPPERLCAERCARRGSGKPGTFTFLGFVHIYGKTSGGSFGLRRQTRRDRMRNTLRAVKEQMRKRMHDTIPEQGRWLGRVIRGYFAYHAVPTNSKMIGAFRWDVIRIWRQALKRQGQQGFPTWKRMDELAKRWLPPARILHPWPVRRFLVNHPR